MQEVQSRAPVGAVSASLLTFALSVGALVYPVPALATPAPDGDRSARASVPTPRLALGAAAIDELNASTYVASVAPAAGGSPRTASATTTLVGEIVVGTFPSAVAVDPTTDRVYVSNSGNTSSNGSVSVIDGTNNAVIATIGPLAGPTGVAVNATTKRIYVGSQASPGVVAVIDASSNTLIATVPVGGSFPSAVAVNEITNRVYVTNFLVGTVSVIDGTTNSVIATVPVGGLPKAIAVNQITDRIYVANNGDSTVSVIEGATNTVSATVAVNPQPFGVAVNPVTDRIYAPSFHWGTISVIAGASNAVSSTALGVPCPNPFGAYGVAVNAATDRIYVGCSGGKVAVLDGSNNNVAVTLAVSGSPAGIGANAATGRAYVANNNGSNVWVIQDGLPLPPPSPTVVVNTHDSGPGSLRAAIEFANTRAGPDTITFNIPTSDAGFNGRWFTIRPLSPLPWLTGGGTTVDGSTQPDTNRDGPEVEIAGAGGRPASALAVEIGDAGVGVSAAPPGACVGAAGLALASDGNRVHGLVLNGFFDAIKIVGSNNAVTGAYIGVDATGTSAAPNCHGINIESGSGNVIGGSSAAHRNVISGNVWQGISIHGPRNRVFGNFIGTDGTGTRVIGNGLEGVFIRPCLTPPCAESAQENVVGGRAPGDRNVLSGNSNGVWLSDSSNVVEGNFIGTDVSGTLSLGNRQNGVHIVSSPGGCGPTGGCQPPQNSDRNLVLANVISGNRGAGVRIAAQGTGPTSDENLVRGNYIGTDASGTGGLGNGCQGVAIQGGLGNVIGGTTTTARNVISGNGTAAEVPGCHGTGVFIQGAGPFTPDSSTDNVVQGNYIGTDITGAVAIGNARMGVAINFASRNLVGGTAPGAGNLISGNGAEGVAIAGPGVATTGNVVQGNVIGTDGAGARALPNSAGVVLKGGASGNTVGGATAGAGNVISGNGGDGISIQDASETVVQGNLIGTDASGTRALPNATTPTPANAFPVGLRLGGRDSLIGGTDPGARNVISGNGGVGGIWIGRGVHESVIQGNFIGTDSSGSAAIPNAAGGIVFKISCNDHPDCEPTDNVIGGSTPGAGNVISGNRGNGIHLAGIRTRVQGNKIGTDASGSIALPNSGNGVGFGQQGGGSDHVIRGNVISGNGAGGISLNGARHLVEGNFIGTNAAGAAVLPNGGTGISLERGAVDARIGGVSADARNVISGNLGGIALRPGSARALIQGNYIGTDVTGSFALPNAGGGIGGKVAGDCPEFCPMDHVIGGSEPGAGNLISGNGGEGIQLQGQRYRVEGNRIGTDAAGSGAIPNGAHGIGVGPHGGANGAIVRNTIAHNGGTGIFYPCAPNPGATTCPLGVPLRISENSIFANHGLGIDLLVLGTSPGVTPNDRRDVDAGPNGLQNFPVLREARLRTEGVRVRGRIDTPSPETVRIELFANRVPSPGGDPSGHGEGAEFLGSATSKPNGHFRVVLPGLPAGTLISATATDAAGNTSEFALNIAVRAADEDEPEDDEDEPEDDED